MVVVGTHFTFCLLRFGGLKSKGHFLGLDHFGDLTWPIHGSSQKAWRLGQVSKTKKTKFGLTWEIHSIFFL